MRAIQKRIGALCDKTSPANCSGFFICEIIIAMLIQFISLFPEMFPPVLETSMLYKAKEKKLFLMEALVSIFCPSWREIRKQVDDKVLGELKTVHANAAVQTFVWLELVEKGVSQG